jgi:hypothetical protein
MSPRTVLGAHTVQDWNSSRGLKEFEAIPSRKTVLLCALVSVASCVTNDQVVVETQLSKSNMVILSQTSREFSWIPSEQETERALVLVREFLRNEASGTIVNEIRINFVNYCIQFAGTISDGKKVIFCNFFPASNHELVARARAELVQVFDGGWRYWSIDYYIEQDECKNMRINGDA